MRGAGRDVRIIYRPTLDDRDWLADRQYATAHGVRLWSGAQVIREELAEALRAAGYPLPAEPRAHRGASIPVQRGSIVARWTPAQREAHGRLDLHVTHAMGLALTAASLARGDETMQATMHALIASRRDAPIAAALVAVDERTRLDRPAPKRPRAAADAVDYVARHLTLCRERAARDAWLLRGGRGRPPVSTVDDHLGRRVHRGDADRIAAERRSMERADARGGRE